MGLSVQVTEDVYVRGVPLDILVVVRVEVQVCYTLSTVLRQPYLHHVVSLEDRVLVGRLALSTTPALSVGLERRIRSPAMKR